MASFNDRDSERQYEEWHRYGKDRGFFDRVSDEVKSWFGDSEAERRRQMDQQMRSEYGRPESAGRSIDNEQPDWQRRDYSGSSPRGSQMEPHGRYEDSSSTRRGMGMRQQSGWGGDHSGRTVYENENYGSKMYGGGRPGMNRSQEFGARSARFFDDSEPGMAWPTNRDYNRSGWPANRDNDSSLDNTTHERSGMYSSPSNAMSGMHRGHGPRNYQRSDERISDEIHQLLTFHNEIDATDIDVLVETGVVTLRGAVDSRGSKRLTEDLVEDVFGVKEVHNELRVNRGDFNKMGQQGQVETEQTMRNRLTSR